MEQGLHFPAGRELVLDFDSPQAEGAVVVSRGEARDVYVGLQEEFGEVDAVGDELDPGVPGGGRTERARHRAGRR